MTIQSNSNCGTLFNMSHKAYQHNQCFPYNLYKSDCFSLAEDHDVNRSAIIMIEKILEFNSGSPLCISSSPEVKLITFPEIKLIDFYSKIELHAPERIVFHKEEFISIKYERIVKFTHQDDILAKLRSEIEDTHLANFASLRSEIEHIKPNCKSSNNFDTMQCVLDSLRTLHKHDVFSNLPVSEEHDLVGSIDNENIL